MNPRATKIGNSSLWREIISATLQRDHIKRMTAAGRIVCDFLGADSCNFYRFDDGRLVLETSVDSAAGSEPHASRPLSNNDGESTSIKEGIGKIPYAGQVMLGQPDVSGGVESATQAAHIVLDIDPRNVCAEVVERNDVHYIRVPLVDADDSLVGLFEAGPFRSSRRAERSLKQSQGIAVPLSLTFQTSRNMDSLEHRLSTVGSTAEISQRLVESSLHSDSAYRLLLNIAIEACRSDAGIVAVNSGNRIETIVSVNLAPDIVSEIDLTPGAGILDFLPGISDILTINPAADLERYGIQSMLAVPISDGELRGILGLISLSGKSHLVEHAGEILEQFAHQILITMKSDDLRKQLEQRSWEALVGLGQTLDTRFEYTHDHHRKVADFAAAIAIRLGLGGDQIESVEKAALVHDLGLSGLAEASSAYEADFQHPLTGAQMVEVVAGLDDVAAIVRTHHEWYIGYGFPLGLKEDEISPEGYSLATAEYLAESLAPGPGAEPPSWDDLRSDIESRSGTQIEPDCGRAALELVAEMEDQLDLSGKESHGNQVA